jgi:hypothetical protein
MLTATTAQRPPPLVTPYVRGTLAFDPRLLFGVTPRLMRYTLSDAHAQAA